MPERDKFAVLRAARRVWAIAAVHGEAGRLGRLHEALWPRLEPGDRLVYLGNMIGRRPQVVETIDSLLDFRRAFLAEPLRFVDDIVYLRGGQEEMWQKLLQLQFATAPLDVLGWMVDQGVGSTLEAYGASVEQARREAKGGALTLSRWTSAMRATIQAHDGHRPFYSALRRAAFTDDGNLLFVAAGLDPSRPLEAQFDSFWWGGRSFQGITEPYGSYRRVVRGFAPRHPGIELGDFSATVDGGCGLGGALMAACFLPSGELVDSLEA